MNKKNLNYESLTNDELMAILEELQILDPLLEELDGNGKKRKEYIGMEQTELEGLEVATGMKSLKVWI